MSKFRKELIKTLVADKNQVKEAVVLATILERPKFRSRQRGDKK